MLHRKIDHKKQSHTGNKTQEEYFQEFPDDVLGDYVQVNIPSVALFFWQTKFMNV
jgi:hypothetical protein